MSAHQQVPSRDVRTAHTEHGVSGSGHQAALVWAARYQAAALEAEQLREAMRSRAVIEQAKGVLMAQRGCSTEEAFALLREMSQTTNTKLRTVAQAIVDSVARFS
jgi:AmiR/NasT family two-component response regulator